MLNLIAQTLFVAIIVSFCSKLTGIITSTFEKLPEVSTSQETTIIQVKNVVTKWFEDNNEFIVVVSTLLGAYLVYRIFTYLSCNGYLQWLLRDGGKRGDRVEGEQESRPRTRIKRVKSPINIDRFSAERETSTPCTLIWQNHYSCPRSMMLFNDGRTAIVFGRWDCPPTLSGEALNNKLYEFSHLSFIWGPCNADGSEHAVDSQKQSMELQLAYVDASDCPEDSSSGSIVIIVVFFQLSQNVNCGFLQSVLHGLPKVTSAQARCLINPFNLGMIVEEFWDHFYLYQGYDCGGDKTIYIIPTWMIPVADEQINLFRSLRDACGNAICGNTRELNTNERPRVIRYESMCCR